MKDMDVEEAKAVGSENAILYDRCASTIFAYLYQQVASPQDAEDLLLEVFLAAYHNPILLDLGPERQLAWLRRVAHNKVIDRYRHNTILTLLPLEQVLEIEDCQLTPEQRALQKESYEQLHRAIAQLLPLQQQLIRMHYGNGLRLVAIADILEKPQATVRKLLVRTLRQLRKMYEKIERGMVNETFQ